MPLQVFINTSTCVNLFHIELKAASHDKAYYTMAESASLLITFFSLFLLAASLALAADPDLLQDICVADLSSNVKLNGFACKPAANVTEADFFFKGLASPASTNNTMGSLVTAANVEKVPGLNTLGLSLSRIDYAPGGLNPPHTHPRATEVVFVLEGALDVGFITTANKLIAKTIARGEVFVFPRGLVHFQKNSGDVPAAVIAAFNSQLPGTQSIAATLFAASPTVPDHVLAEAFQIGTKEVEKMKSRLAPKKEAWVGRNGGIITVHESSTAVLLVKTGSDRSTHLEGNGEEQPQTHQVE